MSAITKGGRPSDVPDDSQLIAQGSEELSVFADMKAELSKQIEEKFIDLVVPNRPNMYVRYSANIEFELMNRWTKSATKGKVTDPKKLATIALHATCKGMGIIRSTDKEVSYIPWEPNGEAMTFDSKEVQDLLGTIGGWYGAILALYGNDGHLIMTMNRVFTEAGYTELDDSDGAYDPLGS